MGIDARWVDERGDELDSLPDGRGLVRSILGAAAPHTVCLRFIDPHGDTVFNQAQIDVLLDELSWLPEEQLSPESLQHLARLVSFIERARGETHTYLKFCGD